MNIRKKSFTYILVFLSFYISLLLGFLFGEDSAGGAITDYNVHVNVREFFLNNTLYGLRNYLDVTGIGGGHSPVFIIFLKYLLLPSELLGRFIFLNLCVLFCPTPFLNYLFCPAPLGPLGPLGPLAP